jgi:hypothetical protein
MARLTEINNAQAFSARVNVGQLKEKLRRIKDSSKIRLSPSGEDLVIETEERNYYIKKTLVEAKDIDFPCFQSIIPIVHWDIIAKFDPTESKEIHFEIKDSRVSAYIQSQGKYLNFSYPANTIAEERLTVPSEVFTFGQIPPISPFLYLGEKYYLNGLLSEAQYWIEFTPVPGEYILPKDVSRVHNHELEIDLYDLSEAIFSGEKKNTVTIKLEDGKIFVNSKEVNAKTKEAKDYRIEVASELISYLLKFMGTFRTISLVVPTTGGAITAFAVGTIEFFLTLSKRL